MNEAAKEELIYAVGEDWNNITPFLIREFLWRKQNRRSVKNLSEEIKAYEKLGELSQNELEKYLASTASAETVEAQLFPVTKLTPEEKAELLKEYGIKTEVLSPVIKDYIKSGNWKKGKLTAAVQNTDKAIKAEDEQKTVKLLLDKMTETEQKEIISFAGVNAKALTPLLIKEYLWRKKNKKSLKNIASEVAAIEKLDTIPQSQLEKLLTSTAVNGSVKKVSLSAASVPVVKLTAEEKQHFQQTYGLPTEGLSPVVQAYIKSGVWRNNKLTNDSLSLEAPLSEVTLSSHTQELPHSTIQTHSSSKINENDVAQLSPEPISAPLKESLTHLAERRHNKKQPSHEMTKLERINANYEHDKAILAKSDPLFAKNQFWDVGYAEESGELTERDIEKVSQVQSDEILQKIKGM